MNASPSIMEVAEATLDDLPSLCQLLGELFNQEADFTPDCEKQRRGLRLILENRDRGCILVLRERAEPNSIQQVIGMVNLLFTQSLHHERPVVWLEDLIIQREFRHAGAGTLLINAVIDRVQAMNAAKVLLLADRTNERALQFYQKHGFDVLGKRVLRLNPQRTIL